MTNNGSSSEGVTEVYFTAGTERWSGVERVIRTLWRDNKLVELEVVSSLPRNKTPIRMFKKEWEALIAGSGNYDQPWHLARQVE